MFAPWLTLWTRSMQIATGAPEVIQHRLKLFNAPGPWPASTVIESQRMVTEKMMAAGETWAVLFQAGMAAAAGRPDLSARATQKAVQTANKALAPMSRRVNANVKRLRRSR